MARRSASLAAFAVVLLVAGQLVAFAHAAGTRHAVCAEHGEQLELARVHAESHGCEDHACDADHLGAATGDRGGDHEDCAILRALAQHSAPSTGHTLAVAATKIAIAPVAPPRLVAITAALYRVAPKTSPPV